MKAFATLTVAGISGIVLLKLFATIILPLLGTVLGIMALTFKLAVIVAVGCFIYSMLRKRREEANA